MDSATERLSDLETVLLWEGEIDNFRIRELLGVQAVWASRLMGALRTHMGVRAARSTAHAPLRLAGLILGQRGRAHQLAAFHVKMLLGRGQGITVAGGANLQAGIEPGRF